MGNRKFRWERFKRWFKLFIKKLISFAEQHTITYPVEQPKREVKTEVVHYYRESKVSEIINKFIDECNSHDRSKVSIYIHTVPYEDAVKENGSIDKFDGYTWYDLERAVKLLDSDYSFPSKVFTDEGTIMTHRIVVRRKL